MEGRVPYAKCLRWITRFLREHYSVEPLTNICAVATIENHVSPYYVKCRLKRDIHSMFVSNRQEASQWFTLVTTLASGGCFETPRIYDRSQIFKLCRLTIANCSPWPHTESSHLWTWSSAENRIFCLLKSALKPNSSAVNESDLDYANRISQLKVGAGTLV